jgi:filamentous hemagglutinin family protein
MPATNAVHNVTDYGATGDGKTDDTHAIDLAIAAASPASAPTGGIVFFPPGTYLISSSLTVHPGMTFQGSGWNTPGSETNVFAGSWLFVNSDSGFSPIQLQGSSGAVRNLGFNVTNQVTSGPPSDAQPMIYVTGANSLIEDVFLFNPYDGIVVTGTARAVIRRVFGQPLRCGIQIDNSEDTNYIDTIHFWSFWQTTGEAWTYERNNATAITLFRCDNPHISNVFASNYNIALTLAASEFGRPHKVHLVNADFDDCMTGIHINCPSPAGGDQVALQLANVTMQAPPDAGNGSYGIWVEAGPDNTLVQASNFRATDCGANAIRIDAQNVSFYGENISLENWKGDTGFAITAANSLAYLDLGFVAQSSAAGTKPYSPPSQFRMSQMYTPSQ